MSHFLAEDNITGDQSYRYLTADEMKSLGDDSLPFDVTKDERGHDSILHKDSLGINLNLCLRAYLIVILSYQ